MQEMTLALYPAGSQEMIFKTLGLRQEGCELKGAAGFCILSSGTARELSAAWLNLAQVDASCPHEQRL